MKKLVLVLSAILAITVTSHAQQSGHIEMTGDINYQHLFLNDDADVIKYSGGYLMELGADYHFTDLLYAGGSLGFSLGIISSEYAGIESWSEIYDVRVPLHVGVSSSDRKFKFDTGPFIDFSVGGKTELSYDSFSAEKSITRLQDTDVNRVSLGWGFNILLFKHLKVSYGIKLTDSAYGKGGETHLITIGWNFLA